MSAFKVNSASLNIRTKPIATPATKLAVLHQGQLVEKIESSATPMWWRVAVVITGIRIEGYVNSAFLIPADNFPEIASTETIAEVHLSTNNPISRAGSGRAFPLNESNQPRRTSAAAGAKVVELRKIIAWLSVDNSQRYLPVTGTTYCNIYAYDYCFLANVFLPRVWWTSKAIASIKSGEAVKPIYDKTVLELNANSLHDWFKEFGDDFGWNRTFSLDDLQTKANVGSVCIMSAKRNDLNRAGHICAVVPEGNGQQAMRKAGVVTSPLQSQAGAKNFRYGGNIWWTSDKFKSFSFWSHE